MRVLRDHAWIGLILVLALGWWIQPAGGITVVTSTMPALPLSVANGGIGVPTLAANGVLYGNAAGVVLVTAQGAANTVLTANAGAPGFSATPTVTQLFTTGSVGVGTGTPANLLHIVDASGITASDPRTYAVWLSASGSASGTDGLAIGDSGAAAAKLIQSFGGALWLNPSGNNVAIGTQTPVADAKLQVAGHYHQTGTTPTVGTCGTSPSILGSDGAAIVTTGSSATTSCLVTFGAAWANQPACVASWLNLNASLNVNNGTTTATVQYASQTGNTFNLICIGRG